MVDDVHGFVDDMKARGVTCSPPSNQGWGVLTALTLPGGGSLGVYQPRHERPPSMACPEKRPFAAAVTEVSASMRERRPAATAFARR